MRRSNQDRISARLFGNQTDEQKLRDAKNTSVPKNRKTQNQKPQLFKPPALNKGNVSQPPQQPFNTVASYQDFKESNYGGLSTQSFNNKRINLQIDYLYAEQINDELQNLEKVRKPRMQDYNMKDPEEWFQYVQDRNNFNQWKTKKNDISFQNYIMSSEKNKKLYQRDINRKNKDLNQILANRQMMFTACYALNLKACENSQTIEPVIFNTESIIKYKQDMVQKCSQVLNLHKDYSMREEEKYEIDQNKAINQTLSSFEIQELQQDKLQSSLNQVHAQKEMRAREQEKFQIPQSKKQSRKIRMRSESSVSVLDDSQSYGIQPYIRIKLNQTALKETKARTLEILNQSGVKTRRQKQQIQSKEYGMSQFLPQDYSDSDQNFHQNYIINSVTSLKTELDEGQERME